VGATFTGGGVASHVESGGHGGKEVRHHPAGPGHKETKDHQERQKRPVPAP